MFFTCQFLGDRYTTRSQIHIFVDVPNLFQLSVLRRAGIKFAPWNHWKSQQNMNLFRLPNNKKSDSYFVDVPNVFHLPAVPTIISKYGVHKQKFLLS